MAIIRLTSTPLIEQIPPFYGKILGVLLGPSLWRNASKHAIKKIAHKSPSTRKKQIFQIQKRDLPSKWGSWNGKSNWFKWSRSGKSSVSCAFSRKHLPVSYIVSFSFDCLPKKCTPKKSSSKCSKATRKKNHLKKQHHGHLNIIWMINNKKQSNINKRIYPVSFFTHTAGTWNG